MPYNTQELISKFRSSGLTQTAFCKKNSLRLSTLHYHLRRSADAAAKPENNARFIPLAVPKRFEDAAVQTIAIVRGCFTGEQIASLIRRIAEK